MLDTNATSPEENNNSNSLISEEISTPIATTDSNSAIDEIDNNIAESSEDTVHENVEEKDYSNLSLEELVEELLEKNLMPFCPML